MAGEEVPGRERLPARFRQVAIPFQMAAYDTGNHGDNGEILAIPQEARVDELIILYSAPLKNLPEDETQG